MGVMQMKWLESTAPPATLMIRLAVGIVFLAEGVQKFLYPLALGAGRFAKIGIPAPQLMGPFVGVVEILGGTLILVGLLVRFAAIPLIVDMLVAIASTKIPILLGHGYLSFAAPSSKPGIFSMLHEARTDLSMLSCCVFLLLVGGGRQSFDARLAISSGPDTSRRRH